MKTYITLLVSCFIVIQTAYPQSPITFGITSGINYYRVPENEFFQFNNSYVLDTTTYYYSGNGTYSSGFPAFVLNFPVFIQFKYNLGIETGLWFTGCKFELTETDFYYYYGDTLIAYNGVEENTWSNAGIPLLIAYSFPFKKSKLSLSFGPEFAFNSGAGGLIIANAGLRYNYNLNKGKILTAGITAAQS
ncbi:MAG: hypothetical protein ACHQFW_08000, partial [Chitinophagales bacterium]